MAKRRHPDGRLRGSREPVTPSARTLRARWVEEEVLKLKTLGVTSFVMIAQHLTKVGRGETQPVVEFPPGLYLPAGLLHHRRSLLEGLSESSSTGPAA